MKLTSVHFENYRLLRDLKLEFSEDDNRPLTVVRAENESGKTTILNALQWALYGDDAIPGKLSSYRLHPIDWDQTSEGNVVPISVTVEFVTPVSLSPKVKSLRKYRLTRKAKETIIGDTFSRTDNSVSLWYLDDDSGWEQFSRPDLHVRNLLPEELREVFFTDGDRALTFIESTVSISTRRSRVERAIRSLLGIELITNAMTHVNQVRRETDKEVAETSTNQDLLAVVKEIRTLEEGVDYNEEEKEVLQRNIAGAEERDIQLEEKLHAALSRGNKEDLSEALKRAEREKEKIVAAIKDHEKRHGQLFRDQSVFLPFVQSNVDRSVGLLDELRQKGQFPKTTVPVLKDKLKDSHCICGEPLNDGSDEAYKRRKNIEQLIVDSQDNDVLQSAVTSIFYRARDISQSDHGSFFGKYENIVVDRDRLAKRLRQLDQEIKDLRVKIDQIGDQNISGIKHQITSGRVSLSNWRQQLGQLENELSFSREKIVSKIREKERLEAQSGVEDSLAEKSQLTKEVLSVLEKTYDVLTIDELREVSNLMNSIFLEMIGADKEQRSVIREALITDSFDIVVKGSNNNQLDPDRDLNGASRRALTLAFILALTNVSGVRAANVIDTPLGMTSGYVKKSILNSAIKHSSQLIMLLTRSEIRDCEDLISDNAGKVYTLTNSAHYPQMLVNDPGVSYNAVLKCDCSIGQECSVCKRSEYEVA